MDITGVVTLISPQVRSPFRTHILIDGYDIPNRLGPPARTCYDAVKGEGPAEDRPKTGGRLAGGWREAPTR